MAAWVAPAILAAGSIGSSLLGRGKTEMTDPPSPWMSEEDYFRRLGRAQEMAGPAPPQAPLEFAPWERIAPEGYEALEEALIGAGTRPLMEDRETARQRFLASMRRIGMADDPARFQLQEETIDRPYGRLIGDVTSQAIAQRYGLQSQDLASYNLGQTQRGVSAYGAPRDYYLGKVGQYSQTPAAGGAASQPYQTTTPYGGMMSDLSQIAAMYKMGMFKS